MLQTRVKDLMKKNPDVISPTATLKEAAQKMESVNCGILPVGTPDKLEGVITDRDIVLRAVAKGKDVNKEKVADYMTEEICACQENDTPDRVAGIMREHGINRVVVQDADGKMLGIVTFGHIIWKNPSMTEIATAIECAVGRKAA
jgi:CBS domain-containing protein